MVSRKEEKMTESQDFHARYRRTIGLFATGVTVLLAEKGNG